MRTAITTKFIGPTNHRGARVIATAKKGQRLTVEWDHAIGIDDNHSEAARQLAQKLGWYGNWHGGGTETGYAFVLNDCGEDFVIPRT